MSLCTCMQLHFIALLTSPFSSTGGNNHLLIPRNEKYLVNRRKQKLHYCEHFCPTSHLSCEFSRDSHNPVLEFRKNKQKTPIFHSYKYVIQTAHNLELFSFRFLQKRSLYIQGLEGGGLSEGSEKPRGRVTVRHSSNWLKGNLEFKE